MIEIDGEFFEPLFYGSYVEHAMILSNEVNKLKYEINKALGIDKLYLKLATIGMIEK